MSALRGDDAQARSYGRGLFLLGFVLGFFLGWLGALGMVGLFWWLS